MWNHFYFLKKQQDNLELVVGNMQYGQGTIQRNILFVLMWQPLGLKHVANAEVT